MAGLKPRRIRLGRDATQRWHLLRTMVTQLVMHERIITTKQKAQALKPLAFKVLRMGKQEEQGAGRHIYNNLLGILTTNVAVKKLVKQIIPRMNGGIQPLIRITDMPNRRRGDNAQMAYIEFTGNELEKYEAAAQKEKQTFDKKEYRQKLLQEELAFFQQKQKEHVEQMNLFELQKVENPTEVQLKEYQRVTKNNQFINKFFQQKIDLVNREQWIENKNKYEARKYFQLT